MKQRALEQLKEQNNKWFAQVTVGEYILTEEDITYDSLVFKQGSPLGGKLEYGTTYSSTLKFTILNRDGKWDDVDFEGALVQFRLGLEVPEKGVITALDHPVYWHTIASDRIVSEVKFNGYVVEIEAVDRMIIADQTPITDSIAERDFPITIGALLDKTLISAGITRHDTSGVNVNLELPVPTDEDDWGTASVRDVIAYVALLTNGQAFFDTDGILRFIKYTEQGDVDYRFEKNRTNLYKTSKNAPKLRNLIYDELKLGLGEGNLDVEVKSNPMIFSDGTATLNSMKENGVEVLTPYEAEILHMPYVQLGDIVELPFQLRKRPEPDARVVRADILQNEYDESFWIYKKHMVTSIVYRFDRPTVIGASGEMHITANTKSASDKALADVKLQTKKQIREAEKRFDDWVSDYAEFAAAKSGRYFTKETLPDGSVVRYEHDNVDLASSTVIWKKTGRGSYYSNNGGKTWFGEDTKSGTYFSRLVRTFDLRAEQITTGRLAAPDNSSWWDFNTGDFSWGNGNLTYTKWNNLLSFSGDITGDDWYINKHGGFSLANGTMRSEGSGIKVNTNFMIPHLNSNGTPSGAYVSVVNQLFKNAGYIDDILAFLKSDRDSPGMDVSIRGLNYRASNSVDFIRKVIQDYFDEGVKVINGISKDAVVARKSNGVYYPTGYNLTSYIESLVGDSGGGGIRSYKNSSFSYKITSMQIVSGFLEIETDGGGIYRIRAA